MAEDANATEVMSSPMPSTLQYSNLIQRATPSERFQRRFPSASGGPFTESNNQVRIPLSLSSGLLLDGRNSYIELEVAVTAKGTATDKTVKLDGGVAGLIESFQILSSTGQVIEDTRNYAQLHNILDGVTKSPDDRRIGGGADGGTYFIEGNDISLQPFSNGGTFSTFASTSTTVTRTFCLNLHSGLLNSDHLLPVGLLTSGSPLTIVLSLGKLANSMVQESGITECSYAITQASYVASCVQLSDGVTESLLQLASSIGGLQVSGSSYSHLTTHSMATGSEAITPISIQMAARMRSLDMLLMAAYDTADSVDASKFSLSCRRRASIGSYSAVIGGKRYPETKIAVKHANQGPLINEIKRCFGNVNKPLQTSFLSAFDYVGATTPNGSWENLVLVPKEDTSGAKYYGSSFYPIDMRVFGSKEKIEHGLNTSSSTSQLVMELEASHKAATQIHVWAGHTAIYTFLSDGNVVSSI